MMMNGDPLPIDVVLDELAQTLADARAAVLRAPPGAGKTTRVPLALLNAPWLNGQRIVLLEPRRLAARSAAARMAAALGETVGQTVGYRMRADTRVSRDTRIEVVTEGVLTRMLQQDPSLEGAGLVIFDEFHERSVHADLGLALTLQARALLRPDLRVLVMSATIEADAVADILGDAPIVSSEGRAWPVETHWLARPVTGYIEPAVARAVAHAVNTHEGDVLAFLPGGAEIRRTHDALRNALPSNVDVYPLYGQLSQDLQDRAIAGSPGSRRKVVLATSIAETSLTIEGVRVVVDSGLMRVPRFSPRTGMSRLDTTRVTRASADQRRGRAGRVAPGICYRLWTEPEDAGLVPHRTPEILETDLAPLALELAIWGIHDPRELAWLDAPPAGAFAHAVELLLSLGAINRDGAITTHGRALGDIGMHPRLAHMFVRAQSIGIADVAADLAALVIERDIMRSEHSRDPDIRLRIDALRSGLDHRADRAAVDRVRREADRWKSRISHTATRHESMSASVAPSEHAGLLLAFAYPDRIAQKRSGAAGRFLLRNGRGAFIDDSASIAGAEFIAIASLDDAGREARIQLAAPLTRTDIEEHLADQIIEQTTVEWDDHAGAVRARRTRSLGAITLEHARVAVPAGTPVAPLLAAAIRRRGLSCLPWSDEAEALRRRIQFAHLAQPDTWPRADDEHLLHTLEEWLFPFVPDAHRLTDIRGDDIVNGLRALMDWESQRLLESFAPAHYTVPTGSSIEIDYTDPAAPVLAVRLQEMFGLADTPHVAGGRMPLTLHLLSPARRPVQVTRDLAGFWSGTYFDVRKDLRGRYPKHYWPDDPLHAEPTRRTKRTRPDQ